MKPTVLVVDDDADLREVLCCALQDEGIHCVAAANGADALAKLRSGPRPDLIILDLMMPVMNGWRFREEQQNDPRLASIPVLILSASRNGDTAAFDARDYLRKPIDLQDLLQAVERKLGK